ncbi:hypothetical protein EK21DRAFT_113534 [Setomelanomma holmii]|uniref:Plasmid pRiA4b Orf3-like domain-containing protein n=1 Tax=Setomelanomma holmii TaxID=210430 RepID=A0A9P4H631_9PLEO|nr:hypothetical protein EK21DRAFT_113534 [Setomelanomma holmii]
MEYLHDAALNAELCIIADEEELDIMSTSGRTWLSRDHTLREVYDSPDFSTKTEVTYEYGLGDGWEHRILFLGKADQSLRTAMRVQDDQNIFCYAGSSHPVAEDCGGMMGWESLKKAFRSKAKKINDRVSWFREHCENGHKRSFDPHEWEIRDVNLNLLLARDNDMVRRRRPESPSTDRVGRWLGRSPGGSA